MNNHELELIQTKLTTLKKTWYGWVKRLKSQILARFKKYGISLDRFQAEHYRIIVEISKDNIGCPDSIAAMSALKVHERLTVARKELHAMLHAYVLTDIVV
jgi:hypothetical protein